MYVNNLFIKLDALCVLRKHKMASSVQWYIARNRARVIWLGRWNTQGMKNRIFEIGGIVVDEKGGFKDEENETRIQGMRVDSGWVS